MARVSAILLANNGADLIDQTMDSLIAQTHRDVEIVIIAAEPSERVQDVLARYGDRVDYRVLSGGSPCQPPDKHLWNATGEFLMFLKPGDVLLPHKLELQTSQLVRQPEVGAVYCGWQIVGEDGKTVLSETRPTKSGDILQALLLASHLFPPVAALVRREYIERSGLFDEMLPFCSADDLFIRVASTGCQFACIQDPLCQCRLTVAGSTADLARREQAWVRILAQVFDRTGVPPEILDLRNQVYARRNLEFGMEHYLAYLGPETEIQMERAKDYFAQALILNPAILDERQDFWDIVAYKSIQLDPGDPEPYVRKILRILPDSPERRGLEMRVFGHIHIILAFRHWQEANYSKVPGEAIQGLLHDPRWLRNRGVSSITVRSLWRSLKSPKRVADPSG